MKLLTIKNNKLMPMVGQVTTRELSHGGMGTFFTPLWGLPRMEIIFHFTNPPAVAEQGAESIIVCPHVVVKGRNSLILCHDREDNQDMAFISVSLPQPPLRELRGTRPIQVYGDKGQPLTQRLYCDGIHNNTTEEQNWLSGYILVKPGEKAYLSSLGEGSVIGHYFVVNDGGEVRGAWSAGRS